MRKIMLTFSIFCMMILMLFEPKICIEGATFGLLLWFQKVLPSLLPFMILINLLCALGILFKLSDFLSPITQRLFKLSGTGFLVFILGLISGYPTGAKLAKNLLEQGQMSYQEAQKSLCYSCNCGPLFIVGTIGTLMLGNPSLGYFLLLIHLISAFIMLLLSRFYTLDEHQTHPQKYTNAATTLSVSGAFTSSVQNAMDTIVYVGGYIIFFSVIAYLFADSSLYMRFTTLVSHLLGLDDKFIHTFFLSTLEFSSGSARLISTLPLSTTLLALISAVIAFGGFCVVFQSQHVLQGSNLSISPYMCSKIFQAIIAYILTFILSPLLSTPKVFISPFLLLKWYTLLILILISTASLFRILSKSLSRFRSLSSTS